MSRSGQSGQSMVELALGVAIFLLAALGAVQLGLIALAEEGIQTATLAGARIATATPSQPNPGDILELGADAALASLAGTELGMATASLCSTNGRIRCWTGMECVRYSGSSPVPGTELPCSALSPAAGGSFGPIPAYLDGVQNPRCHGGSCFGVARSMAGCSRPSTPGRLRVCVAYTSWPPRAVDFWISGGLRPIIPWLGGAGSGDFPIGSQLRLQVEAFSP